MTLADIILALILIVFVLLFMAWQFLRSMTSYFSPVPDAESAAESNNGCMKFILGLFLLCYLVGVLWSGKWNWAAHAVGAL